MKHFRLGSKRGVLLKNTVMLYILQFSGTLLSLAVIPYETRVLGPTAYGSLGVATAVMVYFQLFIDFGFMFSATEEVSRRRDDPSALREILGGVTVCKLFLSVVAAAMLLILCQLIPTWRDKQMLLLLLFLSTALTSLLPDYLYRGLERMTAITVRTVAVRVFFTAAIFVFLKKPEDILVVPILNIIGNGVALVAAFSHLKRSFGITPSRCGFSKALSFLRRASTFFYSRIATTAYTAFNTVLIDILSAGGAATGLYTSADKLITAGKNALSPVSDSLYPYMVKNRDYKLVRKVLLIVMPVILCGCTVAFIWAEPLCVFVFGAEFAGAGKILRAMLPVGIVILPSYICGFPMLSAMGLTKHANYSVIFGTVCHIAVLLLLYASGHMSTVTLGCAVSLTETLILAYRLTVIVRNRDRLRTDHPKED